MAAGGAKGAARRASPQASTTQYTLEELARLYDVLPSQGGQVSESSAMRASAVYACVGLIAGSIASLPLPVYRRSKAGREAVDHDYWWLLNETANPDLSAAAYWEFVVASMLLSGDGFVELVRPAFKSNLVRELLPHHPDRVEPFRAASGELRYRITEDGGSQRVLNAADMLHFPTLGFDGLRSMSPIRHAARGAVSIALAADEYSSRFFTNGARPDFALETEGTISADQADTLRKTWVQRYGGVMNSHLPAILQGGLKVKPLNINAEDAQLIETRGFQVQEIARIYGVPPFMIGHSEKTTSWGSGVEAMGIGFVKYTLQKHLVKIEQELNRKLWPTRETFFVEFNTAGLERGDYKTRMEGYRIALGRAGEPAWMSVNEVRKLENLPPKPGADKLNDGGGAPAAEPKGNGDEQTTPAAPGEEPAGE